MKLMRMTVKRYFMVNELIVVKDTELRKKKQQAGVESRINRNPFFEFFEVSEALLYKIHLLRF